MSLSKEQIENGLKKALYLVLIAGAGFLFNIVRTYVFESDHFFNIKLFDIKGIKSLTDRDVITLSELVMGDKLISTEIEQAQKYIHESLNGSHNDIAKVLKAEYGNEFVCASIASKTWFQYPGSDVDSCWPAGTRIQNHLRLAGL